MLWHAADGRVLEGWVGGDPEGPLVAVLHGCPDTRHVAMTGDAAARAVGVRLLCVNRPGYGRSTTHASTHGSVADDLAGVASELGHERLAVLGMSVGGAYAVATAARHPDRVTALGLVATQPPGARPEPVEELVAEFAPEFLQWRAGVDPADPSDDALTARWLTMLPPEDADLVSSLGPAEVRCPVRAWFGELDDRSGADAAADLVGGLRDVEVVVRPRTTHLATLVAHWPDVLATLRDLRTG